MLVQPLGMANGRRAWKDVVGVRLGMWKLGLGQAPEAKQFASQKSMKSLVLLMNSLVLHAF